MALSVIGGAMRLLLAVILTAPLPAYCAPVAERPDCRALVSGHRIAIRYSQIDWISMPDSDYGGYPDARTAVTCRIEAGGRLNGCTSPLEDPRGPWLADQVMRHFKVLDRKEGGCLLKGRQVFFNFRLMRSGETDDTAPPPPGRL
jgi:hypothetical protein